MATPRFLLAIALLAISTTTTTSAPTPPPQKAASWEEILEWLPEDTETLIVAPQPFDMPKRLWYPEKAGQINVTDLLPLLPGWWFCEEDGLLDDELEKSKCLCIVEGSRCFAGFKDYQGAHIFKFDPASAEAVRKVFQVCRKRAEKKIELHSHPIAVITNKRDSATCYVAQPLPGILICATHQGYLEEMLKRMTDGRKKRAFPAYLREWEHVDVKASVWAIRHYRRETADTDPSSPLKGTKGEKAGHDNAAVGFVFWFNPKTRMIQARYLSEAKDAEEIATWDWTVCKCLKPDIKKAAIGVVEISLELTKNNERSLVLVLLRQIGHLIII